MDLATRYRQKLARGSGNSGSRGGNGGNGLEGSLASDFADDDPGDRAEFSRAELYRIIDAYLGKNPRLYAIADQIALGGKKALKAVVNGDDDYLKRHPKETSMLEVIVRTDGSRPSFMIRDGKVDTTTSPVGTWGDYFVLSEDLLKDALACVGRIDYQGTHVGTGFLVKENLIITNRHVLQAIATMENDGSWQILTGSTIDFGYEFRARQSVNRRTLGKLIFCGPETIDPNVIDHSKLDLALIELKPSGEEMPLPLAFNIAPEWASPGSVVYTIGYPGNPGIKGLKTYTTLLEQLFKSTYGYKRLAPGEVIMSTNNIPSWGVAHDATTLGGNSGSVILVTGKEYAAAGLHYGGTLRAPRENWGHILGGTLSSTNGNPGKSLKDYLEEYEVKLVDVMNG
jgi:hypothetical protein